MSDRVRHEQREYLLGALTWIVIFAFCIAVVGGAVFGLITAIDSLA